MQSLLEILFDFFLVGFLLFFAFSQGGLNALLNNGGQLYFGGEGFEAVSRQAFRAFGGCLGFKGFTKVSVADYVSLFACPFFVKQGHGGLARIGNQLGFSVGGNLLNYAYLVFRVGVFQQINFNLVSRFGGKGGSGVDYA